MKNKKKKSINLLAVEIFLLLTATVLTTVIALNKNQSKSENESNQNQTKKETPTLDTKTILERKSKKNDKDEDDYEEDENYDEENYKIENENLKKDKENSSLEKNKRESKKKDLIVIGSFETTLETEQEKEKNRVHNIKTAAKFLDGVTIKPGEIFSFHRHTWDEGKKNQYKYADTMTQNGMDKGLGGGMCQVSTTLFIAALNAHIKIIERNSHSKEVRYAPLGLDASYFTGAKDLKFKNTRNTPIKIKTYYNNNKLKIEIIGEEDEKDKNYKVILHPAKKEINKKRKKMKTDVLVETLYKGETIKKIHFYSEYNID